MKAAGWQPVRVARSCKKYIALWEAHHIPETILTAADQNVLAGVHDDAAQEEERALWMDEGKHFLIVNSETSMITPFKQGRLIKSLPRILKNRSTLLT